MVDIFPGKLGVTQTLYSQSVFAAAIYWSMAATEWWLGVHTPHIPPTAKSGGSIQDECGCSLQYACLVLMVFATRHLFMGSLCDGCEMYTLSGEPYSGTSRQISNRQQVTGAQGTHTDICETQHNNRG